MFIRSTFFNFEIVSFFEKTCINITHFFEYIAPMELMRICGAIMSNFFFHFVSTYHLERSERPKGFKSTYHLEQSERLEGFRSTYHLERSERLKGSWSSYHLERSERLKGF